MVAHALDDGETAFLFVGAKAFWILGSKTCEHAGLQSTARAHFVVELLSAEAAREICFKDFHHFVEGGLMQRSVACDAMRELVAHELKMQSIEQTRVAN